MEEVGSALARIRDGVDAPVPDIKQHTKSMTKRAMGHCGKAIGKRQQYRVEPQSKLLRREGNSMLADAGRVQTNGVALPTLLIANTAVTWPGIMLMIDTEDLPCEITVPA